MLALVIVNVNHLTKFEMPSNTQLHRHECDTKIQTIGQILYITY